MTGLRAGALRKNSSIPGRGWEFVLHKVSRSSKGPTQTFVRGRSDATCSSVNRSGLEYFRSPLCLSKLKMFVPVTPFPHKPLCNAAQ